MTEFAAVRKRVLDEARLWPVRREMLRQRILELSYLTDSMAWPGAVEPMINRAWQMLEWEELDAVEAITDKLEREIIQHREAAAAVGVEKAMIELEVVEHGDSYACLWKDGTPALPINVPEHFLDILPLMVARDLLMRGYSAKRLLVIKLHGSDRLLARAPLGAAAAPPIINSAAPVSEPSRQIYRKSF
jgi:hypothetical protein